MTVAQPLYGAQHTPSLNHHLVTTHRVSDLRARCSLRTIATHCTTPQPPGLVCIACALHRACASISSTCTSLMAGPAWTFAEVGAAGAETRQTAHARLPAHQILTVPSSDADANDSPSCANCIDQMGPW